MNPPNPGHQDATPADRAARHRQTVAVIRHADGSLTATTDDSLVAQVLRDSGFSWVHDRDAFLLATTEPAPHLHTTTRELARLGVHVMVRPATQSPPPHPGPPSACPAAQRPRSR